MTFKSTIAIALLAATTPSFADAIHIRKSVRIATNNTAIRLGDIATLDGEAAIAMSNVVVAQLVLADSEPLELHVDDIRATLDELDVHWGRMELSGGTVIIRKRTATETGPPLAMQSLQLDGLRVMHAGNTHMVMEEAAELIGLDTLRGWLARSVVAELKVSPSDLQLGFDADDHASLSMRGRFEARPMNNFNLSKRCDFNVRHWSENTPGKHQIISIHAKIKTDVVSIRTQVKGGQTIRQQDLTLSQQWLNPLDRSNIARLDQIIGSDADSVLRQDSIVRTRHLKTPIAIQRGDTVSVDCLIGGGVLNTQAVATESAAIGDMIQLRKGRDRETFLARVTGPGAAVLEHGLRDSTTPTLADAADGHKGTLR